MSVTETRARVVDFVDPYYFDAGGDSIRAIQIVNRLRRAGWAFDVREVFQCPVLCDSALRLARAVSSWSRTSPASARRAR